MTPNFNENLKESFEIIKNDTPRLLKQHLQFQPQVSLENYLYHKYTPLIEAVYLEKLDMVKFICQHVKTLYTKQNIVAIGYKNYLNHTTIDGKSALLVATLTNKNKDVIEFLLNEGANHRIKDKDGHDVFYYADYSTTQEVEDFWHNYK